MWTGRGVGGNIATTNEKVSSSRIVSALSGCLVVGLVIVLFLTPPWWPP